MMYRIEFKGQLLEGFNPQFVRLDVGVRLRLRDAQIERLFSGQTVVLKKAISAESSKAYLNELRSIGLDASLVPLDVEEPVKGGEAEYKVVFWGKILPGFERATVMAAMARRLRVPPAQLLQIFSGSKVVLKRGVTAEDGARLVVDLALSGMQIELESETPVAVVSVQPTPQGVPVLPAAGLQEDDPQYAALLRTACDLSGTPFAGYDSSSSVARDDDVSSPSPVVPPPVFKGIGLAPANADGYLNCPRCGVYQPYAITCSKCGVELPKPRSYVGRADRFVDMAPTTLVNPPEPPPVSANKYKVGQKPAESLHNLMQLQESPDDEPEEKRFSYLKLIVLVCVLLAALAYKLMH